MPSLFDALTIDREKLAKDKAALSRRILVAERAAVVETTREAEKALEAATAAGGLGKLAKAWSSKVYPKSGLAAGPAGLIYPKGGARTEGAIRGQGGGSIRSKSGGVIAIPTKAAKIGRNARPTPGEWQFKTGIRLVAVERRGKPTLLVAPAVSVGAKTGRVRKAGERAVERGRYASAVIFVLMPVVTLRSRLSVAGTLAPYPGRLKAAFRRRVGSGGLSTADR